MILPNTGVSTEEHRAFAITVRTPGMISHQFEVRPTELVSQLVQKAVTYFVAHGQLLPGDYDLALVRDGQSALLADTGRMEDYGVQPGDVLALIAKEPQADG